MPLCPSPKDQNKARGSEEIFYSPKDYSCLSWLENSSFTLSEFVYLPVCTPALGVFNSVAVTAQGGFLKTKPQNGNSAFSASKSHSVLGASHRSERKSREGNEADTRSAATETSQGFQCTWNKIVTTGLQIPSNSESPTSNPSPTT